MDCDPCAKANSDCTLPSSSSWLHTDEDAKKALARSTPNRYPNSCHVHECDRRTALAVRTGLCRPASIPPRWFNLAQVAHSQYLQQKPRWAHPEPPLRSESFPRPTAVRQGRDGLIGKSRARGGEVLWSRNPCTSSPPPLQRVCWPLYAALHPPDPSAATDSSTKG